MSAKPQIVIEAPAVVDQQLVAAAVEARRRAEGVEEEASPSRWEEADAYAELGRRGWSTRKIAEACGTNNYTVSVMQRCVLGYPNTADRPRFWDAYAEVTGEKTTAERIVASTENEWYTPAPYVESARAVLGRIDLDPASSVEANEIVKAGTIFTAEEDGLSQSWRGTVWLNPPYGKLAGAFIERLCAEHDAGRIAAAVALVNAHCTDTAWFQPLWGHVLCFTDHRIDFAAPGEREKRTTSTHGSVFVYLGSDREAFDREFSQYGAIVERRRA